MTTEVIVFLLTLTAAAMSVSLAWRIRALAKRLEGKVKAERERAARLERPAEPEPLPQPEPRPDYRQLTGEIRVCPECASTYAALSAFRAELSCDACVAKRFEASIEADKEDWRRKGWEDA